MKYFFIINPSSGANKSKDHLLDEIVALKSEGYDVLYHFTKPEKNSTRDYIKDYLTLHKNNEEIRFIACGGDGTICEVANGIVGFENASMTAYPCGTGDDFVKSVGGIEKYKNVKNLINAKNVKIDLIKINDHYCINVANFGFDADVVKHALNLKGKVKNPYSAAIFKGLFTSTSNDIKVEVEGQLVNDGKKMLLGNLANGGYEGGKYFCAPNFILDDGLIEVFYVKSISVFKLVSLVKCFEKGEHLKNKKLEKLIFYKRAKKVKVYSSKEFTLCYDGELITGKEFNVEICPKLINFAICE